MKTAPQKTDEIDLKYEKDTTTLSPLPYYSVYLVTLFSLFCICKGGFWVWGTPLLSLIIVPSLELLVGNDGYNPTKEESKILETKISFRMITWLWTPTQLLLILTSCYMVTLPSQSLMSIVGTIISCGILTGGIGITVAHELIHKNSQFEQVLGKITLASVAYLHFFTEHLYGHHKRVSTPEDPASARYGENLYAFLPRSIINSYLSAWNIETKRLHKAQLPVVSWQNLMVQEIVYFLATVSLAYMFFGLVGVVCWLGQCVVAILHLEVVNYIEHYGLQRKELGAGRYERVTPLHSWNADHIVTNFLLFKLQRHADHHTWPYRRYQTLRSWEFSPQLPTGYTGMMMLAFFPPLYFAVMNPKVTKYNSLYHHFNPFEMETS